MYDLRKCPYCSEDIDIELTKCPNCNQWLPSDNKSAAKQQLLEQNYPMGRFLAIAMFVMTLFTNRAILHFLGLAYDEAIFVSQVINLGIKVWLLLLFMQYLLNFKLQGVRVILVWIIISNVIMTILSSASVLYYKSISDFSSHLSIIFAIQGAINIIATLAYIIGLAMAGFNLFRFNGDWIGGLKLVGGIFLFTAVFVPLSTISTLVLQYVSISSLETQSIIGSVMNLIINLLLAASMYNIFSNADKYQNTKETP